jgi:hypothetical protein
MRNSGHSTAGSLAGALMLGIGLSAAANPQSLDIGRDIAGPGGHRTGYELNITYQVLSWLELYGSFSQDRARFTSPYADGTGHVGYYLPNAPFATGSIAAYIKEQGAWSGSLTLRYLGAYPL